MEAILPFKIKNEQKFFESALKLGFNEMEIYKFIYVMQQSDLDIFAKMHDERINILIYGWELCEDYKHKLNPDEWELPEEMEMILKILMPWSMDIWFSKEWEKCKYHLKNGLIHCLNRARDLLMRMPDMMQINWDFLLLYNLTPWNVLYLKNLTVTKEKTLENGAQSIETEEQPATNDDISYVKLEQLPLIVLRLIKLFDQSSIDMVKTLCMRVIAAWNKIHQTELETSSSRRPYIPPEDKRCLLLICHIYLMAVYEADDVKGYVIDNMINNIRFYYHGFQNSTALYAMDNLEYTPARFIALTTIHLRVQKRDFFDFFIWNKYDTSLVNLFGVVSQAYKSYLLGNLLMELNNMNEDDFASNVPLYKRLMNSYVNEREKSELFLLNELEKLESQRYAHNIVQTVKNITDFKSKICKGNRMSNIGNYENSDDTVTPLVETDGENNVIVKMEKIKESKERKDSVDDDDDDVEHVSTSESELRLDPIFQNLPNNEHVLYYVYEVLAKKDYKGWHFAKIVLLVKIIDHELNMIETWRYHPGLTTDFMLNLEVKLSHHYVDLAKIFKDHAFLEQEFWLTAFYLNPTPDIYEIVKRLGMRNNRKRTEENSKMVMHIDNVEAKYGLLSSTIDVKEIAALANTDDPITDYHPLFSALHSLRVPDSLVKDMITAIFLPRNKSFAWVVDWNVLRTRCKMIMTSSKEKKRFVELNMAEANDRLKYLIIDYEKYKNRPQLDYGTIEEGYENLMNSGDFDKNTDEEEEDEEEEEEDFEDDEDVYESQKKSRRGSTAAARKKEEEKDEDDNSQEDDPFLMGKRRTRARTAATLASLLFQTLPRSSRRKKNQPDNEESKDIEHKIKSSEDDNDEKSSDTPTTISESSIPSPIRANFENKDSQMENLPTKNIKECLKERPAYLNSTEGFQHLIDIWNVEKTDLQVIDENCVSLMESSNILQRAVKLKLLNKEINPLGCNEQEHIDEAEMMIHNTEFLIKKEYNFSRISDVKTELMEISKEKNSKMTMDIYKDKAKYPSDSSVGYGNTGAAEGSCIENVPDYKDQIRKIPENGSQSNTAVSSKQNDIEENQDLNKNVESGRNDLMRANSNHLLENAIKIQQETKKDKLGEGKEEKGKVVTKADLSNMSSVDNSAENLPDIPETVENFAAIGELSQVGSESTESWNNIDETSAKDQQIKVELVSQNTLHRDIRSFEVETNRIFGQKLENAQIYKNISEANISAVIEECSITDGWSKLSSSDQESKNISFGIMQEIEVDQGSYKARKLVDHSSLELHYSSNEEPDKWKPNSKKSRYDSHSPEEETSTDGEIRNLKNMCLTRNVKVLLRKLQASDLTSLRQPKIKIRRISFEKYAEECAAKRRRISNRVYVDVDDSSNNSYESNTSSSDAYRPSKVKQIIPTKRHSLRQLRSSESDNDCDDLKLFSAATATSSRTICEKRLSTFSDYYVTSAASTSTSKTRSTHQKSDVKATRHTTSSKSKRRTSGPKSSKTNLVVTPRSASGLKLRISNAEQTSNTVMSRKRPKAIVHDEQTSNTVTSRKRPKTIVYDEIVQLSSSSSDVCIVNDLSIIEEEVIEVESHPLFEEEIII